MPIQSNRFADVPKELMEDPEAFRNAMHQMSSEAYSENQFAAAAQFAVWRDMFFPIAEMGKSAVLADMLMDKTLQAAAQKHFESEKAAGRDPNILGGFDVTDDPVLNGMASVLGMGGSFAIKIRSLLDIMAQVLVNTCTDGADGEFVKEAERAIRAARATKSGNLEEIAEALGQDPDDVEEMEIPSSGEKKVLNLGGKKGGKPTLN